MVATSDLLQIWLAVTMAGALYAIRRLARIGDADPAGTCPACTALRAYHPVVLALMPGCRNPGCATRHHPTSHDT